MVLLWLTLDLFGRLRNFDSIINTRYSFGVQRGGWGVHTQNAPTLPNILTKISEEKKRGPPPKPPLDPPLFIDFEISFPG